MSPPLPSPPRKAEGEASNHLLLSHLGKALLNAWPAEVNPTTVPWTATEKISHHRRICPRDTDGTIRQNATYWHKAEPYSYYIQEGLRCRSSASLDRPRRRVWPWIGPANSRAPSNIVAGEREGGRVRMSALFALSYARRWSNLEDPNSWIYIAVVTTVFNDYN
jgi:hypothetical protein